MPERIKTLVAQSSLPAGGHVFSDALRLSIRPPRVTLQLQVAARSLKTVDAIRIAGRPLPLSPNSWTGADPVCCRIAPDTWLVQSALHDANDVMLALRKGCGRRTFVVTDLSDAFVTFWLEGAHSVALLARGCGLDLSVTAFRTSACTRTRVAQLPVIVRRAGFERFELMVDRAAAQYFHDWLRDAVAGLGAR